MKHSAPGDGLNLPNFLHLRRDLVLWLMSGSAQEWFEGQAESHLTYSDSHSTIPSISQDLALHVLMGTRGPFYYITPEIMDVLVQSAETIPDWTLTLEALPTTNGVCWFGKKLLLQEPMGRQGGGVQALGLVWQIYYQRTLRGDPAKSYIGYDLKQIETEPGAVGPVTTRVGFNFVTRNVYRPHNSAEFSTWPINWKLHTTYQEIVLEEHDDSVPQRARELIDQITIRMAGFVGSLFTFLHQDILVRTPRRNEVMVRSADRTAKPTKETQAVEIIQLRKRRYTATGQHEADPPSWSCRWIVGGHWRKQWYPSLGRHQPRWIAWYMKGPDDKPLKAASERIFAVTR